MDDQEDRWIAASASALLAAEHEQVPIEALTARRPGLPLATAYRVQARLTPAWSHLAPARIPAMTAQVR